MIRKSVKRFSDKIMPKTKGVIHKTEKGRPVARTAFPVSRQPHIGGRSQDV
jgi:hypothetical protein